MNQDSRDLEAARRAVVGFLASIGLIAILTWFPARYFADWAVYPRETCFGLPTVRGEASCDQLFEMSKWDFRNGLAGGAVMMGWFVAIYWLAAFVMGAAKVDAESAKRSRRPDLWLAFALFIGIGMAFLQAAPRFALGPAIDACVRSYDAAHPNDPCIDCGIHGCEGGIHMAVSLTSLVVIALLMGWSLRLRHRARRKELV